LLTGVNVVNPQWKDVATQRRLLDELQAAGVRTIRVPLTAPYRKSIAFIRRASDRGISLVLVVRPTDPRAVRPGTVARDGRGVTWRVLPLSGIDPQRFAANLRRRIGMLARSRVKIAAFEFGNEINWTPFNGDFPLPGAGRILSLADLHSGAEGRAIAAGYDVYLELLSGLRRIVEGSARYRGTPIVSAGLSDPRPAWLRRRGMDAVSLSATLQYLRARGLDRLVDGYGIHIYPGARGTEIAARRLRATLAKCTSVPAGKPCWVTEWGFRGDPGDCDDSGPRPELVTATLSEFEHSASLGKLKAAIYYAWSGDADPYGIFRCGRLSRAGMILTGRNDSGAPSP
jgi:hypothetical protein